MFACLACSEGGGGGGVGAVLKNVCRLFTWRLQLCLGPLMVVHTTSRVMGPLEQEPTMASLTFFSFIQ